MFHADEQTDVMKLRVVFRNFGKALETSLSRCKNYLKTTMLLSVMTVQLRRGKLKGKNTVLLNRMYCSHLRTKQAQLPCPWSRTAELDH